LEMGATMKNKAKHEFEAPESCADCPIWRYCLNDKGFTIFDESRHPDCPLKIAPETPEGEMKPCPFCGAEADFLNFAQGWRVVCYTDGCANSSLQPYFSLKKQAIAAWNRRA